MVRDIETGSVQWARSYSTRAIFFYDSDQVLHVDSVAGLLLHFHFRMACPSRQSLINSDKRSLGLYSLRKRVTY
jgi:hypothetical protein